MKILILVQAYPSARNPYAQMWAHSRNTEYLQNGQFVDVLSFSSEENYTYEGVNVIAPKNFDTSIAYDLIVSHQPNLRNHLIFLSKNFLNLPVVFFIHGHEVMITKYDYSKPYFYIKDKFYISWARLFYDIIKLKVLKIWFYINKRRFSFIFVSRWMKDKFQQRIEINVDGNFKNKIIPNSVNQVFIHKSYDWTCAKDRDFLTIRQLDWSKHCVDKVVELAWANPDKKFTLYGMGSYFEHNPKPHNLEWISSFLQPYQIPCVLDKHKCALMPSRVDSQGVMMCEMATYGIPVITSNIEICREMLNNFKNVLYLPFDEFSKKINFDWIEPAIKVKKERFDGRNLVIEELLFFDEIVNSFNN